MELVTFEELNAILGLSNDETHYEDLEVIKNSVFSMFENYTHRKFDDDNYTELVDVLDTKMVQLEAIPIKAVSLVLIDGVETNAYKITKYGLLLASTVEDSIVTVSYSGGIEDVPGNLNRAALLQTVYEYQNKHSIGQETVSTSGGTVTKPQLGMLKEVEKLLNSEIHPFPWF